MLLSSIHVYPIKSCAGISISEWEVDAFGLRYDRRWMVVTPRGQFLTQREADDWFSDYLGAEVMLAYMPPSVVRPVDASYAPDGGRASFSDGFPFLLIGEASLADLNVRLAAPVPMNRFRPNLVVSGSSAFAEDGWRRIRIGGIPMQVVKPCARCVVTTTDRSAPSPPSGARTTR